ncbi:MAG TPA: MaoC family dehydratase [Planctomycetota bacterium]|nr:MaoC family dehydratase [Planctomycetota bacterium]
MDDQRVETAFAPPLLVPLERLAAFEDRTALRDPKARTQKPSLVLGEGQTLEVRGPFQVRRTVQPTKARGTTFVHATGDPNPIHTEGFVVPGAWTASQMVAPLEVLFPRLQVTALRVSFTGVAWYDRPVRITLRVTPGTETMAVEAQAYQGDREIARGEIEGKVLAKEARVEVAERKVDTVWLGRVEAFFRSLGIAPASYIEKVEGKDHSYPYAFLASLPSGEMVERLSGQGGILNRLTLEFDAEKLPVAGPPEVSLELPERLRKSFNKIVTKIKEGVLTAVRGSALILPRSEAPAGLLQSMNDSLTSMENPGPR